jgi:hypothetical protein
VDEPLHTLFGDTLSVKQKRKKAPKGSSYSLLEKYVSVATRDIRHISTVMLPSIPWKQLVKVLYPIKYPILANIALRMIDVTTAKAGGSTTVSRAFPIILYVLIAEAARKKGVSPLSLLDVFAKEFCLVFYVHA